MNNKKKIRFYLEGGGAKCTFQLSMLKHLFTNKMFNDNFELESLWTISFGAVMGYLFLLDEIDVAYDLLKEGQNILVKSIDLSKYTYYLKYIPYFGNLIKNLEDILWILFSLNNYALFKQDTIELYLKKTLIKNTDKLCRLNKLNVIVYNLTKNKSQVINGNHPLIIDYILASMSVWLIFPPKQIKLLKTECECDDKCNCFHDKGDIYCNCSNDKHKYNDFMDIGFINTIPFESIIEDKKNDFINCFLLTNEVENFVGITKGNNLLEYLYNIIDNLSTRHQKLIIDKINFNINNKDKIIHIITNDSKLKISEIDAEKINNNIKKGIKISKKYLRYLNSSKKYSNKIISF